MSEREPSIEYQEGDDGVRPTVFGANAEKQMKGEWYDSTSNAKRGLGDLRATLNRLHELGEIE